MSTNARKHLTDDLIIELTVCGELTEAQVEMLIEHNSTLTRSAFIAAEQVINQ